MHVFLFIIILYEVITYYYYVPGTTATATYYYRVSYLLRTTRMLYDRSAQYQVPAAAGRGLLLLVGRYQVLVQLQKRAVCTRPTTTRRTTVASNNKQSGNKTENTKSSRGRRSLRE